MVYAVLKTCSGKVLAHGELDIERDWLQVLKQIGTLCGTPPSLHRILVICFGSEVVVHPSQLASQTEAGEAIDLIVAFDMEELRDILQKRNASSFTEVLDALTLLFQVIGSFDDSIMDDVVDCFKHADPDVRRAAVNIIIAGTKRGDSTVIDAMLARLGDTCDSVAASATAVLGHVTEVPHEPVVERLKDNLNHRSSWVRRQTIDSLACVAKKGDSDTLAAISPCLNDDCHTVRLQAVKAITNIADSKDPKCTAGVAQLLSKDDAHPHVKAALTRAITQLANL